MDFNGFPTRQSIPMFMLCDFFVHSVSLEWIYDVYGNTSSKDYYWVRE